MGDEKRLDNTVVLYFPIIGWGTLWQRAQQLSTVMSSLGAKVYHIHPHITYPTLSVLETTDPNIKQVALSKSIYQELIPNRVLHTEGVQNIIEDIYKLIGDEGLSSSKFILWVNAPYWCDVIADLKEKLDAFVVFDILDKFDGFDDLKDCANELSIWGNKLNCYTDLVTYTAVTLLEHVATSWKNESPFLYLPNGCNSADWDFSQPTVKNIVGYSGTMAQWFDPRFIDILLKQSDCTIELVGPLTEQVLSSPVPKDLRVIYNAPVDHAVLKGILRRWSCGVIPFHAVPLTHCTDPVKLYEYYAVGLPVVATKLHELEKLNDTMQDNIKMSLAETPEIFVDLIKLAIEEDTQGKRNERRKWAWKNNWSTRIDSFLDKMEELID